MTGPAMVNIFAPTPKTNPSACVQEGRSVLYVGRAVKIGDLQQIGNIV
jgi:hypothetical protein